MIARMLRRGSALALTALVATAGMAGPAQASTARQGSCEQGEFCYFYNSDNAGSVSDFGGELLSLANYGADPATCYVFRSSGKGNGECIKNNAASVWNRTTRTVRVYYRSAGAGTYQSIAPGFKGNLNAELKNNNASHRIRPAQTAPGPGTAAPAHTKIAVAIKAARAEITAHPKYAWGGGHGARPGPTRGHCDSDGGYVNGVCVGESRIGFDCSGLMRFAFFQATGVDWGPKTTRQLYANRPRVFGTTITDIGRLRPGDLVLIKFSGTRAVVNHTAIVSKVDGTRITIVEAANSRAGLRESTMSNSTFRKAYRLA